MKPKYILVVQISFKALQAFILKAFIKKKKKNQKEII